MSTLIAPSHRLVEPQGLLKQLHWRYATKKFDPSKKISPQDWSALEQTLVLSASSFGLQPWKFIVVNTPAIREKLMAASWGQRQMVDASHLVVFAYKKSMGEADVKRLIDRTAEVTGATAESLEQYRQMMVGSLAGKKAEVDAWSARQVYIALGDFLTAAALMGIDACPMEGFDPSQHDQILALGAKGYSAVVMATVGYRAEDDKHAHAPKVRFKTEEMIEHV